MQHNARINSGHALNGLHQVASEHKKSEALVTRIMAAAVQRARSLDSMNQGLAEQLQRARSDIAQVTRQCTMLRARGMTRSAARARAQRARSRPARR